MSDAQLAALVWHQFDDPQLPGMNRLIQFGYYATVKNTSLQLFILNYGTDYWRADVVRDGVSLDAKTGIESEKVAKETAIEMLKKLLDGSEYTVEEE